jgi:hypothetical protein
MFEIGDTCSMRAGETDTKLRLEVLKGCDVGLGGKIILKIILVNCRLVYVSEWSYVSLLVRLATRLAPA